MPWSGGDAELYAFFRRAIAMRRELLPLRRGDFRMLSAQPGSGLLVYSRRAGSQRVTVCLNRGPATAALPIKCGSPYWAEHLTGNHLSPHGFAIFVDEES